MISLQIKSDQNIHDIVSRLTIECNSVSNIKSSKNSKLILSVIGSIKDRLKYYNSIPKNGLLIYCGIDNLLDKKLLLDFEPPKPLKSYKYNCHNKFDTIELENMLNDDKIIGFIVIDGNGLLCAKLKGTNYEICYKITNNLPRKHNKGGQSSVRFERLYNEKKLLYIRKCCDIINNIYISNEKINVDFIILGGIANIKNKLFEDIKLDQRIKIKINKILDIGSGQEQGLQILISQSQDLIKNNIYLYEKSILSKLYNDINTDVKNISIGINETIQHLKDNFLEKIIIYEKIKYDFPIFSN